MRFTVLLNLLKKSAKSRNQTGKKTLGLEGELGVMVSELDSQSKGRGLKSCLFQILHGNGIIAMPGLISIYYPILVHKQKIEKYRYPNVAHRKKHLKKENIRLSNLMVIESFLLFSFLRKELANVSNDVYIFLLRGCSSTYLTKKLTSYEGFK